MLSPRRAHAQHPLFAAADRLHQGGGHALRVRDGCVPLLRICFERFEPAFDVGRAAAAVLPEAARLAVIIAAISARSVSRFIRSGWPVAWPRSSAATMAYDEDVNQQDLL